MGITDSPQVPPRRRSRGGGLRGALGLVGFVVRPGPLVAVVGGR